MADECTMNSFFLSLEPLRSGNVHYGWFEKFLLRNSLNRAVQELLICIVNIKFFINTFWVQISFILIALSRECLSSCFVLLWTLQVSILESSFKCSIHPSNQGIAFNRKYHINVFVLLFALLDKGPFSIVSTP